MISVIVPVYRVKRYLPKCIESVINQTYKNLEIILVDLVDDGSPDKCPEICERFAQKDKRNKVIHKENGGVSSTRNLGMSVAQGEYISFVDSDDWLPKNSMELLINEMKETNADLVYRCMIAQLLLQVRW